LRIRSLTALRAAADIVERFRRDRGAAAAIDVSPLVWEPVFAALIFCQRAF
jgi:hypothetical protein